MGCFAVPSHKDVRLLEGQTSDLTDDPIRRIDPVQKCGKAATDLGYSVFAVAWGYCISGSSSVTVYTQLPANACSNGNGGYHRGAFLMDVYEVPEIEQPVQNPVPIINISTSAYQLAAIQHVGCYVLPRENTPLKLLEGLTTNLTDDPLRRTNPILRCGVAALEKGYSVFGVSLGFCISGSSNVFDYQHEPTDACSDGKGGYQLGVMHMDVYVRPEEYTQDVGHDSLHPSSHATPSPTPPVHIVRGRGASGFGLSTDDAMVLPPTVSVEGPSSGEFVSSAISQSVFSFSLLFPLVLFSMVLSC